MSGRARCDRGSVGRARGVGAGSAVGVIDEVGASNAGLVGIVDHDAAVTHEGAVAGDGGDVLVNVTVLYVSDKAIADVDMRILRGREGHVGGLAMLAGKVTDLASSRGRSVAGRVLAAQEGIHVCARSRAVARAGNGVVVNVVH